MGKGFEATVELLLSSNRNGNESINESISGSINESINEGDASVIIISGEDESPVQKRARRISHEEQGATMFGSGGRRSHEELGVSTMSGSEKRCLEELKGVVAAVSGVIGSTSSSSSSSSSSSTGDGVLQRIAR